MVTMAGQRMPILAGSYKCKSHDTRYTYELRWDEHDGAANWSAKIFDGRRLATETGSVAFADDAETEVRTSVEAHIEAVTCRGARLGSCARSADAGKTQASAS